MAQAAQRDNNEQTVQSINIGSDVDNFHDQLVARLRTTFYSLRRLH